MSHKPLRIYRSSAGSGKTYTLTREYLKLALADTGDRRYRRILAVTFTNKAMQEMKDRIVSQLASFVNGKELNSMALELMESLALEEAVFRQRCSVLLSDILHDYSHFSITTIDAFFQRVIRGFARELGLAGSYRLELEADLTIHEILQDLMAQVEDDRELRDWMIRFALNRLEEGNSWVVESQLKKFAEDLLKEDFQEHEHRFMISSREELHALNASQAARIQIIRNTLEKHAREGIRYLDEFGLSEDDFTYKKSGPGALFSKLLNGDIDFNKHTRRAIETNSYTTGKQRNEPVEKALDAGLRTVFKDLLAYWDRHEKEYRTAVEILKNSYLFGLTLDILHNMKAYKKEHDIMFISDATRLLTDLVENTDALFIYEKVGSFYDHFLIDEFQDTSGFQWRSFRPLIENSLSEGHRNLIVGDVKQSIYRWRGGELELLQEHVEAHFGPGFVDLRHLQSNFRSKPAVVMFNNAVFSRLRTVIGNTFPDQTGIPGFDAAAYINAVYHDVEQEMPGSPGTEEGGYVHVEFFPKDKEKHWKESSAERLPEIVEELQEKGVPLKEIAILVRKNREGQEAAKILSQYAAAHPESPYRYDVISNDSLFLSGSPACRLLVAALRFLRDPHNSINRAELAYHYHSLHGGDGQDPGELFPVCGNSKTDTGEHTTPEQLILSVRAWHKRPFYDLVEELIGVLGLGKYRQHYIYLQTFMDHVLTFVTRDKGDISSFLTWWDDYAKNQSIKVPDDLDAIRILTIHKSKGLEFHSVIIPYLQWTIDHDKNPLLWLTAEEIPGAFVVPVNYKSDLAETYFNADYQREKLKAFIDNFNLLYVALTRAIHDLWLFGPALERNKEMKKINEVIHHAISSSGLNDHRDVEELVFSFGERDFSFVRKDGIARANTVELNQYTENRWEDNLVLKPVSSSLIDSERKIRINTGIIIHQLLSRVRYMDDFEKILADITWEEALSAEDAERIREHIRGSFENPVIKGWFSKKWQVVNESAILTREQEYRPDRVMMDGEQVVIVDYKTGLQRGQDVLQMKRYKELLQALEGLPVSGYLWYIDLQEIAEV